MCCDKNVYNEFAELISNLIEKYAVDLNYKTISETRNDNCKKTEYLGYSDNLDGNVENKKLP